MAWHCQYGSYLEWEDLIEKPLLHVLTGRAFPGTNCETCNGKGAVACTVEGSHTKDCKCKGKETVKCMGANCNKGQVYPNGQNYVPPRFNRVLGQTLMKNPDIVCYQELDHFEYFQTVLGRANYSGYFLQKIKTQAFRFNGRSHEKEDKFGNQGNGHDGAAVFWDNKKFEFVHAEGIDINMVSGEKNKQVCCRVVLQRKQDNQIFAVYAAHMKSGKAKDRREKEHQASVIAKDIAAYRLKNPDHSIIFAADFNCHNKPTPSEVENDEDGSTPHTVFHSILNKSKPETKRSSKWMGMFGAMRRKI